MIAAVPLILASAFLTQVAAPSTTTTTAPQATRSPEAIRAAFLKQLDRPRVALDARPTEQATRVKLPAGLTAEALTFASEKHADGRVERVPVLLVRPSGLTAGTRAPAVIVLHGTGGTKEAMAPWLIELARRGFVALAIDARYHGARVSTTRGASAYIAAITQAWRTKNGEPMEHPFYYDTCWDLWRTLDYLETRPDVDAKRIGMLGTSMGGIQTWLAAAADRRVAAAVPAIGVQSFRWSLENDAWQGRANTIKGAHDAAAADLGEQKVNAKVCKALWSKVIPGILDDFDCPNMLRLMAPRPLLILNGEKDPNCPIGGAKVAFAAAESAYAARGARDQLTIDVAADVGHTVTPEQRSKALNWLVETLKPKS